MAGGFQVLSRKSEINEILDKYLVTLRKIKQKMHAAS